MSNYRPRQRTKQQNKALHLYFTLVANALNDGGFSVQLVLREKMDLEWTSSMVKELLWRPAQEAIIKKHSTTRLAKISEIDLIYDHLNRHLSEKFWLTVPFPISPETEQGLTKAEDTPYLNDQT